MSEPVKDFDILSSRGARSGVEERWVSFQPYLLSKGYRLRPRYHPDWVPSWRNTDLRPAQCEDNVDSMPIRVLDAIRVEDDCQVILKMIIPSADSREGEAELDLLRHFSTPPLKDDPSNHVVPCLDSFPIPDVDFGHFVVMPLLGPYNENPPFHNLAEVHDCLEQLFEGLIFMHKHDVAHCDISSPNIMMDSRLLFNEPFHPVYQTLSTDIRRVVYPRYLRSQKNMRYYFIDLGYAQWFRDPKTKRLTTGTQAREPAPEQLLLKPYDPFLADIYQLGAVLRNDLIPRIDALGALDSIAAEMTQINPADRPSLDAARRSMNKTFLGLGGWRYRRPIVPAGAGIAARSIYFVWGISSEIAYWMEKIWRFFFRRRVRDGQV